MFKSNISQCYLSCLSKEDTMKKGREQCKTEQKRWKMMPNSDNKEDLRLEVGYLIAYSRYIGNKREEDQTLPTTLGSLYHRR